MEPLCQYEPSQLDIAEYQYATIEYDYRIHPDASKAILKIFENLARRSSE
jgi:hypothetical protein